MSITCPNCDHKLYLKSSRPGRFRPGCPACNKPFLLIVSDRPEVTVQVRALATATSVATRRGGQDTVCQPISPELTAVPAGPSGVVLVTASHAPGSAEIAGFTQAPIPTGTHHQPVESSVPTADALEKPQPVRLELRGYAIEREIGRGGMGTVYLARQLSLDRPVALKVMSKRWATDPVFVARFTREAYAAAQLSHPNIVQIHDIGETNGIRFFSMEYVPGRTLADLVKLRGKLDPETAVGYILQAARGLKHAHDRGMIHRDVKPDNLLLDDQGLVKISDLGLVKTPSTRPQEDAAEQSSSVGTGLGSLPANMTGARIALGTPAYMSPEQCRDAAAVDHRADIYSLGCTLYVLVTGRPPFDGTTAVELMTKHAYEPLVPPEHIVARVPREVSDIIQRMMAKNAEDRFQSMAEVIRTLETWLGIQRVGNFCPNEEQISRLEGYVHQFNHAPTVALRRHILTGCFAAIALATVLIAFFGKLTWTLGLVGLVVQASFAYFVLDGLARRGHLFTRTRRFVFGLEWGDWLIAGACLTLFGVMLAMLHALWIWIGFGIIGVGLAFALRYGLDRTAEEEQREPVEACERVLPRLRAQGLEEEEIQYFVAKYAGRDWEGLFEALFGFEAKLATRAILLRGGAAGVRHKNAAWREPLIAVMDRIEKLRKAARERELLEAVERAELLAAGTSSEVADDKARAAAEAMVRAAGVVRAAEDERATKPGLAPDAQVNIWEAVVAAEQNPLAFIAKAKREAPTSWPTLFVGPHVRAVLAAILLAACGLWVHQNAIVTTSTIPAQVEQAFESRDFTPLQRTATRDPGKPTRPLVIAGVPYAATGWVDSWNIGAAGLLLLASLLCRGNVMAVLALLGAAVAAVGHQHGIHTVEPFRGEHVALMLGFVLALVGFRTGR